MKDWEIIPVIATQLEYDDISDDHKTSATREKIVLLSIESLEYYLTNSHRFYNFNFLYNEIKKLIPNTSIGLKRHM